MEVVDSHESRLDRGEGVARKKEGRRTHFNGHARIYISVDGNVAHGENARQATQPSFSLNSRRLTARACRLDGSDGAGARRGEGWRDREGGWRRLD